MAADRRFEEAAIEYTRAGRAVFPVNGKAPYTARGFKDATKDEDQIRRWWSTWPDAGIATPIRAGEFVLDIDDLASVDELPRELPTSAEAKTGSGGRHVWFGTSERVTNSPGNLPGGIHVRGQGGYVVLPPSRHPSGAAYEWIRAPQEHPFAQAPGWLLRLIKPPSSNGTTPPTEGDIPEETRNIALTSMAGAMRRSANSSRETGKDVRRGGV
jgi:putative DNA primase/helicase